MTPRDTTPEPMATGNALEPTSAGGATLGRHLYEL